MRTLIVTGPGGAGTSTLAAAAAVRAGRSGRRTLLLSRRPVTVAGLDAEPGLEVAVVDARASLEQLWNGSADAVAEAPGQSPSTAACGSTVRSTRPGSAARPAIGGCRDSRTVRRPARAARTAAAAASVEVPAPPGPVRSSVRTGVSPRRAS